MSGIRDSIAHRQWADAWDLLAKAPRNTATLNLKVEVALALDRRPEALSAWKLLWENGEGDQSLKRIATDTARRLLTSSDPLVRLESERLLATNGDKDSRARLQRQAEDSASTPLERAGAAAALVAAGVDGWVAKFSARAAAVPERDRFNLIRLTDSAPDEVALKLLTPMLRSSRSDVRYGAVLALGERRGPAVSRVLREFLANPPEGAARLAAILVLAAQGDRDKLAEARKIAPYFGDRERLAYARALLAVRDPEANRYIALVQNSDNEMLRLEAAALVAKGSPATGRDILIGALGNQNLWVRLRALELLRTIPPQPNAYADLLLDPEEWVRLRSAELALVSQETAKLRGARP